MSSSLRMAKLFTSHGRLTFFSARIPSGTSLAFAAVVLFLCGNEWKTFMNTNSNEPDQIGTFTISLRSEDANVIRALLIAVWALRDQPGFDKAAFEAKINAYMPHVPSQETKDILKAMV